MFSHDGNGFEPRPGVFNEDQWVRFDNVIASAAQHGIRLVATFENQWEAYGGIDTVLGWCGKASGEKNRWVFYDESCPCCREIYREYVKFALSRRNTVTGVLYREDPTIMSWELMNEPRYQYHKEHEHGQHIRAWIDEMGTVIKSIDPDHLIGAGIEAHESRYGYGSDEGAPFSVQESTFIDWTTAHLYPNTDWAHLDMNQTLTLINAWCSDASKTGKPFVLGEFNAYSSVRSKYWAAIFHLFETTSCGDGSLFWWYQDHPIDPTYGVSQGDPELVLFRAHSEAMKKKQFPLQLVIH